MKFSFKVFLQMSSHLQNKCSELYINSLADLGCRLSDCFLDNIKDGHTWFTERVLSKTPLDNV